MDKEFYTLGPNDWQFSSIEIGARIKNTTDLGSGLYQLDIGVSALVDGAPVNEVTVPFICNCRYDSSLVGLTVDNAYWKAQNLDVAGNITAFLTTNSSGGFGGTITDCCSCQEMEMSFYEDPANSESTASDFTPLPNPTVVRTAGDTISVEWIARLSDDGPLKIGFNDLIFKLKLRDTRPPSSESSQGNLKVFQYDFPDPIPNERFYLEFELRDTLCPDLTDGTTVVLEKSFMLSLRGGNHIKWGDLRCL